MNPLELTFSEVLYPCVPLLCTHSYGPVIDVPVRSLQVTVPAPGHHIILMLWPNSPATAQDAVTVQVVKEGRIPAL